MTLLVFLRRLATIGLLLLPTAVIAAPMADDLPIEIGRDFRLASGYIVAATGDEFLIDLGSNSETAEGDLFSVVGIADKVIHPLTGEVLGNLEQVKGVLQVTRVKPGFSHARARGEIGSIKPGDAVRRFEGISAVFLDPGGQKETIFLRLKTLLPHLIWQRSTVRGTDLPMAESGLGGASEPRLYFTFQEQNMEVRNSDFQLLRVYDLSHHAPALATAPATDASSANGGHSSDFIELASLPERILMGTFVRADDRLLLGATDGNQLLVYQVDGNPEQIAAGRTTLPEKILSLHWWQPEPAVLILVVTAQAAENRSHDPTAGSRIASALFRLEGDRLVAVKEELAYFLGTFDRDGDGVAETLLGQAFDRDTFFGHPVKEFHFQNGQFNVNSPAFDLPSFFPVQGSIFVDLTGDGKPETAFIRNRSLFIYQGDKKLYESTKEMGGSLVAMTYDINPGAVDRLFATHPFELAPVAADLDGDSRPELIAVASDGSRIINLGLGIDIRRSWLTSLSYRNSRLLKEKLGHDLELPIQGLGVDGDRLLLVITEKEAMPGGVSSRILALPLE